MEVLGNFGTEKLLIVESSAVCSMEAWKIRMLRTVWGLEAWFLKLHFYE